MVNIPYIEYDTDEMSLRDYLALHRTKLANERTYLSYIRTALAISGGGITFAKFFEDVIITTIGWIMVPIGVFLFLYGVRRYFETKGQFKALEIDQDENKYEVEFPDENDD